MRRWTHVLIVAGLVPITAAAGTAGTFEAGQRGHVLVPVSVNGMATKPFAVDTGATLTVLDAGEFAALSDGAPPDPHPPHASGAHGAYSVKTTTIDSLVLWQLEQQDQLAALMTLSQLTRDQQPDFVGVLGLPTLRQYRVDLDYPARRLAFDERGDDLPPCDICSAATGIPIMPLVGGLPSVPVKVNGVPMTALLDTGASRTILNEAAIAALGLGEAGTGEAIGRASIALGSLPAREHEISRIDLPVFRTLQLDTQPAIILGIDYLGSGRTVLDLAAGVMWFEPADAG